ncbi:MAG: hypothetical protein ACKOCK_09850 [Chloroflexota bacterium]
MATIESFGPGVGVSGIIPGDSSTIVVVTPIAVIFSRINWGQGPQND